VPGLRFSRCIFIYFCSFIKYFLMQPQGCQFVQIYRGCQRHAPGNKTDIKKAKKKKMHTTNVLCWQSPQEVGKQVAKDARNAHGCCSCHGCCYKRVITDCCKHLRGAVGCGRTLAGWLDSRQDKGEGQCSALNGHLMAVFATTLGHSGYSWLVRRDNFWVFINTSHWYFLDLTITFHTLLFIHV